MSIVVFLCLAPSAAVVVVGVLRARPRKLPEPYVRHRPHLHPAVVLAELAVRQAYRELAPLYDTPALSRPPAR
ncbi:hypothetical protein OG369_42570 [Streptomyces sp. NBC_01221]|uniref:hypothetical protein n=1 Tax=Streptomyces sp. NBC_01221 TaxID=2903782 RepID=UPI0022544D35|nr:hypothetical protein [Streptomyces sp. NBC_01221]MCX4792463.1 hypothetical protein [Streptomyces sp. NBC_01221]